MDYSTDWQAKSLLLFLFQYVLLSSEWASSLSDYGGGSKITIPKAKFIKEADFERLLFNLIELNIIKENYVTNTFSNTQVVYIEPVFTGSTNHYNYNNAGNGNNNNAVQFVKHTKQRLATSDHISTYEHRTKNSTNNNISDKINNTLSIEEVRVIMAFRMDDKAYAAIDAIEKKRQAKIERSIQREEKKEAKLKKKEEKVLHANKSNPNDNTTQQLLDIKSGKTKHISDIGDNANASNIATNNDTTSGAATHVVSLLDDGDDYDAYSNKTKKSHALAYGSLEDDVLSSTPLSEEKKKSKLNNSRLERGKLRLIPHPKKKSGLYIDEDDDEYITLGKTTSITSEDSNNMYSLSTNNDYNLLDSNDDDDGDNIPLSFRRQSLLPSPQSGKAGNKDNITKNVKSTNDISSQSPLTSSTQSTLYTQPTGQVTNTKNNNKSGSNNNSDANVNNNMTISSQLRNSLTVAAPTSWLTSRSNSKTTDPNSGMESHWVARHRQVPHENNNNSATMTSHDDVNDHNRVATMYKDLCLDSVPNNPVISQDFLDLLQLDITDDNLLPEEINDFIDEFQDGISTLKQRIRDSTMPNVPVSRIINLKDSTLFRTKLPLSLVQLAGIEVC